MRKLLVIVVVFLATATTAQAGIQRLFKPMVHMQRVMGMPVAKHAPAYHWYMQVKRGYENPPHKRSWLCIHRYEGSWKDPNSPYYGGIQMDLQFQKNYGYYLYRLKGTADHWSILEQMWTAEKAHRSGRGFYPWPNTARYCGLI